jgi:hypothetical protein
MEEHSMNFPHCIQSLNTNTLFTKPRYMPHIIEDMSKIEL